MTINKKLMAVAVATAFGVPLAAHADVTVYGKLYPQINHISVDDSSAVGTTVSTLSAKATGTPGTSVTEMQASNSRLGFRGAEDLGGGLKTIFQLEMNAHVNDGTGGSTLWSRNTFVGLRGGFGTVKLGKIDTVYKQLGDHLSFLGVSSGNFVSASSILAKTGFGTSSASSFHLRRDNSIIYESPKVSGFQGLFDYSLGQVPGSTSSGSVVDLGLRYKNGPIYLAVAHEIHKDLFGGSNNVASTMSNITTAGASSNDTSTRLTGQYHFNEGTVIELDFATTELNESGGATGHFQDYKHNSYAVNVQHTMGPVKLQASYVAASAGSCSLVGGVACNTTGLDGKMLNLGTSYSLSKRTYLFALYQKLNNGDGARYNSSELSTKTYIAPGAGTNQFAVGISHSF
ncbi:major outer membrane protein P.IB precursor [mine drainage metagenome]|uniref:Major outer membrane protein P.IB n=1 Tax=mine drainage metagenome TaxID=410659 RepID=A0A1J5RSV0_9ZZZZ